MRETVLERLELAAAHPGMSTPSVVISRADACALLRLVQAAEEHNRECDYAYECDQEFRTALRAVTEEAVMAARECYCGQCERLAAEKELLRSEVNDLGSNIRRLRAVVSVLSDALNRNTVANQLRLDLETCHAALRLIANDEPVFVHNWYAPWALWCRPRGIARATLRATHGE